VTVDRDGVYSIRFRKKANWFLSRSSSMVGRSGDLEAARRTTGSAPALVDRRIAVEVPAPEVDDFFSAAAGFARSAWRL